MGTKLDRPHVILLHGLARNAFSMRSLARAMSRSGYTPLNLDYPSRKHKIQDLAFRLIPQVRAQVSPDTPLYLVTHSMGGLVGRQLMHLLHEYRWEGAVFLAPPHGGSHLARTLSVHPTTRHFFRWFYGPAGREVAQETLELPLPHCPYGVIAGTQARSWSNPISWFSHLFLKAKSDGTVLVDETHLERMFDYVEVDVNHTTIMNHADVQRLVQHFFQHHSFSSARTES